MRLSMGILYRKLRSRHELSANRRLRFSYGHKSFYIYVRTAKAYGILKVKGAS